MAIYNYMNWIIFKFIKEKNIIKIIYNQFILLIINNYFIFYQNYINY